MATMNSLQSLYVHQLKDLYSAEKQISEALPKMAQAASSPELKKAFEQHLEQTRTHLDRLTSLLRDEGENPGNKKCKGMEGLIEEGSEALQQKGDSATKDAALIGAAQKVEHYEIAGYGTVQTYAKMLGNTMAASTLQKTLNEEGETDKKLTRLAEGGMMTTGINEKARV
jgi:ferritin-like metal-binding protein YciE